MNNVNDVTESANQGLPADFETPGAILKAAREKAGLAAGDLARQLNLSESKLLSLEEDQYDKLASDVFAQGYLRRYAKLLGLDDDVIVQRFNEYQALLRQSEQGGEGEENSTSAVAALPRWALPAAVFVVAVVVLTFIYMRTAGDDAKGPIVEPAQQEQSQQRPVQQIENQTEEQQAEEQQIEEAAPELNEPSADALPVQQNEPLQQNEQPQQAPAENSVALPAAEPEPAPVQTPAPAQQEAAPATVEVAAEGEDVLSFAFSEECWVEVSNAQGTVLYADLARAGQTLSVEGEAPFSVMLGNARAVSLTLNGELVSVNPRAGNRTARLTVGG
ncbi:helix-turn-helix domain-containing protein [Proteobacteria bacterium 005FR1]|nr:helix-turn-helix domain-containing protein [Proteobacteria bacterium 005FR1]